MWHWDDSSLKYYYNPAQGADLSRGYESFVKHDDTNDEHLDGLLRALEAFEHASNSKIEPQICTWVSLVENLLLIEERNDDEIAGHPILEK